MYAVIYWLGDDECFPLLNNNDTITLYEKAKNADAMAEALELETSRECRVISIESVND